jgi:hypothetical protein
MLRLMFLEFLATQQAKMGHCAGQFEEMENSACLIRSIFLPTSGG